MTKSEREKTFQAKMVSIKQYEMSRRKKKRKMDF